MPSATESASSALTLIHSGTILRSVTQPPPPTRPVLKSLPTVRYREKERRFEARKMVGGRSHSEFGPTAADALNRWLAWYHGPQEPLPRSTRSRQNGSEDRPEKAPRPQTISDLFDLWLEGYVRPYLAVRTHETYEGLIRLHLRPRFGDYALDELDSDDIAAYFTSLAMDNMATTTISRIRTTLESALGWAVRPQKWIAVSPMKWVSTPVPRPGVRARDHRQVSPQPPWTPNADEVGQFLSANEGDRLWAMWIAAFALAVRPSEIVALGTDSLVVGPTGRPELVSVHRKLFRGRERDEAGNRPWLAEEPKRGSSRTLAAPPGALTVLVRQAAQILEERRTHPEWDSRWDGLLFRRKNGQPFDPAAVPYLFGRACRRAGGVWVTEAVDEAGKVRILTRQPYCARHFCLSQMLEAGVSPKRVSAYAGHRTTVMLERTYAHVLRRIRGQQTEGEAFEKALPAGLFGSTLGSDGEFAAETANDVATT